MTVDVKALFGLPDDPREVELVQSILDKTRQGKIPWIQQGNAITAAIPNGLQANFVLAPSLLSTPSNWQLFTVRNKQGRELIRANNSPVLMGSAALSPLVAVSNELFRAVRGTIGDDLDHAIDSLKKL